jgi:hypothetical protein
MNHQTRTEYLWTIFHDHQVPVEILKAIKERWEQDVSDAYERGFETAAGSITRKIQERIPPKAVNVEEARLQAAWRDAAMIAYDHLGQGSET